MTPETPTTPEAPKRIPFHKRLRVRVVASFSLLAIAPFLFSIMILFHMAQRDVLAQSSEQLTERATFLAAELSDEISRASARIHEMAKLDEVCRHMAGDGPFPTQALALARRLEPQISDLVLEPGPELAAQGIARASQPVGQCIGFQLVPMLSFHIKLHSMYVKQVIEYLDL